MSVRFRRGDVSFFYEGVKEYRAKGPLLSEEGRLRSWLANAKYENAGSSRLASVFLRMSIRMKPSSNRRSLARWDLTKNFFKDFFQTVKTNFSASREHQKCRFFPPIELNLSASFTWIIPYYSHYASLLIGSSTSFDRFFHPFGPFFRLFTNRFCPPFFHPFLHHPFCSISGFSASVSSSRIDFLSCQPLSRCV